MSELQKKADANVDALLRTQQSLIEAHLALIKMQQQLLGNDQLPPAPGVSALKTAVPSLGEISNPMELADPAQVEDSDSDTKVRATGSDSFGENGRSNAIFIIIFVFLTLSIAYLALKPRTASSGEIVEIEKSLQEIQSKLAESEQALREAQQAMSHPGEAKTNPELSPRPLAQPPTAAPAVAKPSSKEQRLARAQLELRNARTALAANQRELLNNLREYRDVARKLALTRQSIFQRDLEMRRSKGELTDEELTKQQKSWGDFLPPKARPLMQDPRLDDDLAAASTSKTGEKDFQGLSDKNGVPDSLPEVQTLLVKTASELTAVMKQLTGWQADIIQAQADLKATIDGAAQSRGGEASVPQDQAARMKPSVLRTTASGGKSAAENLRTASSSKISTSGIKLGNPTSVEVKPLTDEQRLAQLQQDLRNTRMALVANERELIKNLREYRATARTLAMNRQSIFQTGLEIRRAKGEISNEELTAQKKSWEEFLPPKVRPLMTDSRLEVAADVLSGAAIQGEGVHGLRPEDDMPATMPETLALINKSVAELTALMKQLTNTQADIVQTQSELTDEMGALDTVTKEFLALQAATADSKSGSTSSASAETGKPSAKDAPDASATKPAVKK